MSEKWYHDLKKKIIFMAKAKGNAKIIMIMIID